MDNNQYQNYYCEDEEEIDLQALFFHCHTKWKQLVICLVIGALIGAGFAYLKIETKQDQYDAIASSFNPGGAQYDSFSKKMEQLDENQSLYDESLENESGSLLLCMDADNTCQAKFAYMIEGSADELNTLGPWFTTLLDTPALSNQLMKELGSNATIQDVKSLVRIEYTNYSSSSDSTDSSAGALISAYLCAPDEKTLSKMLSSLNSAVTDKIAELSQSHTLSYSKMYETSYSGTCDAALAAQQAEEANQDAYLAAISDIKQNLSAEEQLYYTYNYNHDSVNWNAFDVKSLIKWPIIFALGLFVLDGAYIVIAYILDGHLKTEAEISDTLRLRLLASIDYDTTVRKGLDKRIHEWIKSFELEKNNIDYVKSLLASPQLLGGADKKLLLCAGSETADFANELSNFSARVVVSGNLGLDQNAIELTKNCDAVAICVKLGKTMRKDVERQIAVAKALDKPVLGIICIKA